MWTSRSGRACFSFLVPATAYNLFAAVIEDSENKFISLLTLTNNVEKVKTPEEVKRKIQVLKNIEKAKYAANSNNIVIMKNNLNHLVPCHVNRLFNSSHYMTYDNDHTTEEITSEEQAKEVVPFCSKFVEAVVILDNYWFFTTSFSIFIHNNKIDDCADQSRVGSQKEVVSFIRKKTRTGRDYFELTTRLNSVELFSTSGFFKNTISNSVTAFLGSSIRDLPLCNLECIWHCSFTHCIHLKNCSTFYKSRKTFKSILQEACS